MISDRLPVVADTGKPLYRFGHGLSYTEFELSWSAAAPPPTVTVDLDSPHFISDFEGKSFAAEVKNVGKIYGRETVLAYWSPNSATDLLKQQLFNFSGHWLEPGASAKVMVELPHPVDLASITEDGDRVIRPGEKDNGFLLLLLCCYCSIVAGIVLLSLLC